MVLRLILAGFILNARHAYRPTVLAVKSSQPRLDLRFLTIYYRFKEHIKNRDAKIQQSIHFMIIGFYKFKI